MAAALSADALYAPLPPPFTLTELVVVDESRLMLLNNTSYENMARSHQLHQQWVAILIISMLRTSSHPFIRTRNKRFIVFTLTAPMTEINIRTLL